MLMSELKEIAEKYQELQGFVAYWEPWKSHVFAPFRGGGLPGLNMSEPGNVTFKPPTTVRLVKAAIYDVVSMLHQESQIYMFERNLLRCTGRGQTKSVRDARDRAEQIRATEEFANVFMDDDAVALEAIQGMNPDSYIPKKSSSHRAPKKSIVKNGGVGKGRGKGVKRVSFGKQLKEVEVTEEKLCEMCVLAMEVVDDEITPETKINIIKNPPLIILASPFIHKCKGCRGAITPEDKEYPHDMVFHRMGVSGYYNGLQNKWIENETIVHFHLNMKCLHKNDMTIEARYVSGNDETFVSLDRPRMEFLHSQGLLKPFAKKKFLY